MSTSEKNSPVQTSDVRLVPGKGATSRGGGPGGNYWHIYAGNSRAGYIFINVIHDDIIGDHASVQIHLNQSHRGRHIGRVAYRLACEMSQHDTVYAHMRKSNIASRKAAEQAGFTVDTDARYSQLVMMWKRKDSGNG